MFMDNKLEVLTKSSTEGEIKIYFEEIFRLKQSGEEFPVNLEIVYSVVYNRKEEAVRVLKTDFIEDVDYQVLRKNAENTSSDYQAGGRPITDYYISVSCMEFFIARKIRSVFEVYRQVFHKVVEQKSVSAMDVLKSMLACFEEQEQKINALKTDISEVNEKVKQLEEKTTTPKFLTIARYAQLKNIVLYPRQEIALGKQAVKLSKEMGYAVNKMYNKRFGSINTYTEIVLDTLFKMSLEDVLFD